ncbi:hypothetical protein FRC04_011704 [Tulasnella sp. 424]|nr:hypothetical protein FRC04_011704 [Tulasnella sp. 424]KAG8978050.1 hypothetical protein FRC05_011165 [Tulasnella sp. 425]
MLWKLLTHPFRPLDPTVHDRSARSECVFCHVEKENILAQSDGFIVFRDRKPAAKEHLLVVSRQHIASVRTLRKEDIPLLKDMEEAGKRMLLSLGHPEETHIFGYHIPPFNSVDHLHLHAQALPYHNTLRQVKYPRSERHDTLKGWTWFIESSQVLRTLEANRNVTIKPC